MEAAQSPFPAVCVSVRTNFDCHKEEGTKDFKAMKEQ